VSGEFFLRSWSYHIVSEGRVTGMGRPRGDEPSGSGGREPPVTFNDGQLTAAGMGEGDGEWSGEAAEPWWWSPEVDPNHRRLQYGPEISGLEMTAIWADKKPIWTPLSPT
jgi:hypothetical protein